MDLSNISMKTRTFAHSYELIHPLLLQLQVTKWKKGSNYSDFDIAEPPSKKPCRELMQPSTMKRKYLKNWKNEFSWLVCDEYMNGAFAEFVHKRKRSQHTGVFGS